MFLCCTYVLAPLFPVSVVVGVPTIKREVDSYLTQTLESLLTNLDEKEQEDCLIIVFVAEVTFAAVQLS